MRGYWFKKVKFFTLGWFIALMVWRLIRKAGIKTYFQSLDIQFSHVNVTISIFVTSILAGIIFGSLQYYYEHLYKGRVSFKKQVFRALIIHLTIMVFLFLLMYLYLKYFSIIRDISFNNFIINPISITTLLYSICVNAFIIALIYLNKLLGKGNLVKLVTGSFYNPKEEFRAFMFLDLQSSTKIAENLGHIEYSKFIQECFYDLSVIESTKAEIYQYVGDEVVLTWNLSKNRKLDSCLDAFYLFKEKLQSKEQYYNANFGVSPKFTAGFHIGPVIVAEVGDLKREIAYHGDTINVASRIQGECKTLNKEFLVSEKVIGYLKHLLNYKFEKLETTFLRGKKESTILYSVDKNGVL